MASLKSPRTAPLIGSLEFMQIKYLRAGDHIEDLNCNAAVIGFTLESYKTIFWYVLDPSHELESAVSLLPVRC